MQDAFVPASDLLGAALPRHLAWDRAGRPALLRLLATLSIGVLAALAATTAWQRLESAPPAAPPLVRRAIESGKAVGAAALVAERAVLAVAKRPLVSPLPHTDDWSHRRYGAGEASYYARGFEGRPTASGEAYRAAKLTAAHRTLPFGTLLRVTNERNGRSVVVRVNDRGPFHARRVVDLSRAAAAELGIVRSGRAHVRLDVLSP